MLPPYGPGAGDSGGRGAGARPIEAMTLDRPRAPEHVRAARRLAFEQAHQSNAIEGLPPPSDFALQIEEQVIDGLLTCDEAVALLIRQCRDTRRRAGK